MQIYIASSWKNQHAVEMLTDKLRTRGHEVLSFVENNHGEQKGHAATKDDGSPIPFDEWVWSERGERSFQFDVRGASECDLLVYIGPSGTDAWAEVGVAWAAGKIILGLWAKGEQAGLMRRMAIWFEDHRELLKSIDELSAINSELSTGNGVAL
ncbi:hypothetical protein ACFL2O_10780 [Thermodesulfobacteriota bacterium]